MSWQPLTKAQVLGLQPSFHHWHIRLYRLDREQPRLTFDGRARLYIARAPATKKLPERLATITTADMTWAEGGYRDVQDDGSIVVEDYMLKIFVDDGEEDQGIL